MDTLSPILTGSVEFFGPSNKDADYLVFREQPEVFVYARDRETKTDFFCYRKGLTKSEYFHWHRNENTWLLNFAPLITKEFLDRMDIDIFDSDYDDVFWIMRKAFAFDYRISTRKYLKYLYRLYIYKCFIENGTLALTDTQRSIAFDLYKRVYKDRALIKSLYEFFGCSQFDTELGMSTIDFAESELCA